MYACINLSQGDRTCVYLLGAWGRQHRFCLPGFEGIPRWGKSGVDKASSRESHNGSGAIKGNDLLIVFVFGVLFGNHLKRQCSHGTCLSGTCMSIYSRVTTPSRICGGGGDIRFEVNLLCSAARKYST